MKKKPLDVGADLIARTAHAALRLLGVLRTQLGAAIPLAWDPADVTEHAVIEVYPAATLKAHGIRDTRYKKNREHRLEIVEALRKKIDIPAGVAKELSGNSDRLDAAVCVLAARDFVTGRAMPPPDRDRRLAEREGWIWTAKPES